MEVCLKYKTHKHTFFCCPMNMFHPYITSAKITLFRTHPLSPLADVIKPNFKFAVADTFFTNRFPSLRIFVNKKVGNQKN